MQNIFFYNHPKNLTNIIQKIQNRAARIVKKMSKHERISPVLMEMHWLPVEQRIKFKAAVLFILELLKLYSCTVLIFPT